LHLVWEKWPFFGLAALSSVLTFMAHRGVGGLMPVASLSLIARIGNAVMSYAWYVGSTFWPARLAVFYPYPGVRPLSLLLPLTLAGLVLTAAAFWARRKRRYVLTGWLWFLGALAPVIGVVQAGSQARADRFMYVPMIGLLILAAWGMADLGKRWRWPVRWIGLAGIVLLLLCGARAAVQVRFWRNSETLFRHALSVTGKNYLAHTCLGSVLSASGQTGEAIRHFGHALSIAPNYAWAHSNLGHALAKQGRIDEAVVHGRKAISLEPDSAEAHANLGYALAAQGRMEEAIAHCRKAISLKTDLAKAHSNLGYALAAQGRMEEAIVHCRKALSLKPDFVDAHVNLGRALAAQGHLEEAISHYNEALSLKPDLAEGHSNLGAALAAQGRVEQAITHYRKAVSLRPGLAEAHSNLGAALAAKGRVEEAIAHYLEALSLRPDLAEEHHALGGLLAAQGREDEAIGHYRKALAIKPDFAEAYFNLGALHAGRGEPGEAVTLYRQALKISPDQAAVRNNLAWLLATASEPGVRNAAESLRLAERANELTQGKIPIVLDTLAAAYAEASRFPEAVLTAQKALERAKATGQTNLIGQIQARLELYRKNEPFREKPAASGGHDTACRIE
jgi:tetratricopeptide (TPR) repeat protein